MDPLAPQPFPIAGRGRRIAAARLALALAGSAGMHAWLAGWLAVESQRPVTRSAGSRLLEARLATPARPVAARLADPAPPAEIRPQVQSVAGDEQSRRAAARGNPSTVEARPSALPAAVDPNYYDARDLDVFPRPVAPIDLEPLPAGRHRFTLLIDEAGRVTAVEGERLPEAQRAALAATRFHPAYRDGRAVRSRVQIELDPARAVGAPR